MICFLIFFPRSCFGGLGHNKPQGCDWLRSVAGREEVIGICCTSLHTVAAVPGYS